MAIKKITVLSMLFLAAFVSPTKPALASVSGWQKGADVVPQWTDDFSSGSFQTSISKLHSDGANFVTLVIPLYQSNIYSTDIQNGWNTPSDASLIAAISYAHSLGMQVMLKPHLESYDGNWRAHINPSDRIGWFANYQKFMDHYLGIAKQNNAEWFTLGTELISMSSDWVNGSNSADWRALIAEARTLYSGSLTYSANWGASGFVDEKNGINFWDALDAIGISAYFDLSSDSQNSVPSLMSAWNQYNINDIGPLHSKWNKPILFTEIGYRSVTGAHWQPWNAGLSGSYDASEQDRDYQTLFQYWDSQPYLAGIHIWDWSSNPNAGGSGDTNYTVQNKPAEATIKQWFTQSSGSPPPPPPPSALSFTTSAPASPSNPSVGSQTSISVGVKSSAAASDIVVDVEVFDQNGGRALQKFFEHQNFSAGAAQTYSIGFTAQNAGNYSINVGIFSSGWSSLITWNSGAGTFTAGSQSTSPPPPQASTIDIWWPVNGAVISGVQPFKALLQDHQLSQYSMYWQVDSGQLNFMADSQQDFPHKETLVDTAPWTWHGNGPYEVNFVAKDSAGAILFQRSISIQIDI